MIISNPDIPTLASKVKSHLINSGAIAEYNLNKVILHDLALNCYVSQQRIKEQLPAINRGLVKNKHRKGHKFNRDYLANRLLWTLYMTYLAPKDKSTQLSYFIDNRFSPRDIECLIASTTDKHTKGENNVTCISNALEKKQATCKFDTLNLFRGCEYA